MLNLFARRSVSGRHAGESLLHTVGDIRQCSGVAERVFHIRHATAGSLDSNDRDSRCFYPIGPVILYYDIACPIHDHRAEISMQVDEHDVFRW